MNNVAFLTSAAGTQHVNMWKFIKKFKLGREILEEASDVLKQSIEGLTCDENKIDLAQNTNPALFTYAKAINEILQIECGIVPKFMLGHSLGEYAALEIGGYVHFDKTLFFLHNLGLEYQKIFNSDEYGMAIITGNRVDLIEKVVRECEDLNEKGYDVYMANINCDTNCGVAGSQKAIDKLNEVLKSKKGEDRIGKLKLIDVKVPTHTPLVKSIEDDYKDEFKSLIIKPYSPKVKLVSSVTGNITPPYKVRENLEKHLSNPVMWRNSIITLMGQGIDFMIELSPRPSLAPYNDRIMQTYFPSKRVKTLSSNARTPIELILEQLEN